MDISTLQSKLDFIKSLYFHEEWKDEKCRNEILAAIEMCHSTIEKALAISMFMLWDHKPSIEAVEKVVRKFPSTLSYNVGGRIPIQNVNRTVAIVGAGQMDASLHARGKTFQKRKH